jgi:signal transduction histidine kinase
MQVRSDVPHRLFLPVSSILYGGVLITGTYYNIIAGGFVQGILWRSLVFIAILLFLLVLEQCEWRRLAFHETRVIVVSLLITRIVLLEVLAVVDTSGLSRALYPIVPFLAFFSLGKRFSYGLALIYMAMFVVKLAIFVPHWYSNKEAISGILMFFIGLIFALSMAHVASMAEANRRRAEGFLSDLSVTHEQLKIYASQATALATAEERNRLARDIHDGLGHYLTTITILLEKAIAFSHHDPAAAENAVLDARRLTREALVDVRQSVGALRRTGETTSLASLLRDLTNTLQDSGITMHLEIVGNEADFLKSELMALYRAAQEAVTNIQKHANARNVSIQALLGEEGACLIIDDDGQGFDTALLKDLPLQRSNRLGLQGMRERLEMLGGIMEIESQPTCGTRLIVSIPRRMSEPGLIMTTERGISG